MQCIIRYVRRGLVVDRRICEGICFMCLGCSRVRTRGAVEKVVGVERAVGTLSMSPTCCRQLCTPSVMCERGRGASFGECGVGV